MYPSFHLFAGFFWILGRAKTFAVIASIALLADEQL